jgi:hypothetical protein
LIELHGASERICETTIEGIKTKNVTFQITTWRRAVNSPGVIHGQ